jgi:SAM-dependent methyltransferase
MPIDVKDSFDKLSMFSDASLDFIIGCHVIEHLIDPVGAIAKSYDRLRDGGWLFLIVPDQRYTFDVNRETTTFEHLLQDFKSPNRSRDYEHYIDYYTTSAKTPDPKGDAKKAFEGGKDVHFHTWTCLTFYEMVDQIRSLGIAPWRRVWWQPKISSDSYAMEFYFALGK